MKHTAVARLPIENPMSMKMASLMPMLMSDTLHASPPAPSAAWFVWFVWFDNAVTFMRRGVHVGLRVGLGFV